MTSYLSSGLLNRLLSRERKIFFSFFNFVSLFYFICDLLPIIWFKTQFLFQDVVITNGLTFTHSAPFDIQVFLLSLLSSYGIWLENDKMGHFTWIFSPFSHLGFVLNKKPNFHHTLQMAQNHSLLRYSKFSVLWLKSVKLSYSLLSFKRLKLLKFTNLSSDALYLFIRSKLLKSFNLLSYVFIYLNV